MGGEAVPNSRHAGGLSNAPEFDRLMKLAALRVASVPAAGPRREPLFVYRKLFVCNVAAGSR